MILKKLKNQTTKQRFFTVWGCIAVLAIMCLVCLEYITINSDYRAKAFKSSKTFMVGVERMIENNISNSKILEKYLSDIYISKAKSIAQYIDANPYIIHSSSDLAKLAEFYDVDEINLFNDKGVIIGGSVPNYFGYSMDYGEQLEFFKPMLEDKSLTMAQHHRPNAIDERDIPYFICWNENGSLMVQLGIELYRLPKEFYNSQIGNLMEIEQINDGINVYIADNNSKTIISSTIAEDIGKSIDEVGLIPKNKKSSNEYISIKDGAEFYCTEKALDEYSIIVVQDKKIINKNVPIILTTFAEYMIMVFIVISFFLEQMYDKLQLEKIASTHDQLTGLFNRREYENTLLIYRGRPLDKDICFVSFDINGLKLVNDNLGHQKGDLLIVGASECIKKCFGEYGRIFRIGGDEFSAIIFANKDIILKKASEFGEIQKEWSKENDLELHISLGYARYEDYFDKDVDELIKISDQKMYEEKAKYYKCNKKFDRRCTEE